jgi:hypothetical protein
MIAGSFGHIAAETAHDHGKARAGPGSARSAIGR